MYFEEGQPGCLPADLTHGRYTVRYQTDRPRLPDPVYIVRAWQASRYSACLTLVRFRFVVTAQFKLSMFGSVDRKTDNHTGQNSDGCCHTWIFTGGLRKGNRKHGIVHRKVDCNSYY